ncbi:MAG: hypothetical protein A2521_06895 [Deltaproteobacteria bacterium RIFOXYD12_FULL_57_12]|nr:MAG: hypothetical protein A2521_06895 [Deltaproteobacteria bacterium RIFOXYD12_FULL_57_12]
MPFKKNGLIVFLLIALSAAVVGCFRHEPVRHLASDAGLVVPGKTTRQDVLVFFGEPDERQTLASGEEVWIYSQVRKSLMRKTPMVGNRLGSEEYDVVNISLAGDLVTSCVYRMLDEGEFKRGGKRE